MKAFCCFPVHQRGFYVVRNIGQYRIPVPSGPVVCSFTSLPTGREFAGDLDRKVMVYPASLEVRRLSAYERLRRWSGKD
jgi:cobalamin biosynthesis Mg chelatase CobN